MTNISSIYLLFIFSITLHNIEEALWLPQWSKHAKKFHKQVEKNEFHFALIIITLLAYLVTALFIFYPDISIFKYSFFGYLGVMIINAIFPHVLSTIVLKKYAPGVLTGILLNVPINSLIIIYSINMNVISLYQIIISTVVMAILILTSLPNLFKLGRRLINY